MFSELSARQNLLSALFHLRVSRLSTISPNDNHNSYDNHDTVPGYLGTLFFVFLFFFFSCLCVYHFTLLSLALGILCQIRMTCECYVFFLLFPVYYMSMREPRSAVTVTPSLLVSSVTPSRSPRTWARSASPSVPRSSLSSRLSTTTT